MAVHPQYPTNVLLPDLHNRAHQAVAGEGRNPPPGSAYGMTTLEDYQLQPAPAAGPPSQLRLFGSIAGTNSAQQSLAGVVCNTEGLGCNPVSSRKRSRGLEDPLLSRCPPQQLVIQNLAAAAGVLPQSARVCTGLKLAFEDEHLNPKSTSIGRGDGSSLSFFSDEISTHIHQQTEEINRYLKAQGEQVRQSLEERRQRHCKGLLAAIEEGTVKYLREKETEFEKVNSRNKDLEERVKQLIIEAHLWQKQAKNNEAMVTALRNNLQQAVALSLEQSREGCGDSEADDAASSHHDNLADAHARAFQENKELKEQRTCRVCQCNDVSILLLPCRHLCLCKNCETRLNACPICRCMKNASVQVYMS